MTSRRPGRVRAAAAVTTALALSLPVAGAAQASVTPQSYPSCGSSWAGCRELGNGKPAWLVPYPLPR